MSWQPWPRSSLPDPESAIYMDTSESSMYYVSGYIHGFRPSSQDALYMQNPNNGTGTLIGLSYMPNNPVASLYQQPLIGGDPGEQPQQLYNVPAPSNRFNQGSLATTPEENAVQGSQPAALIPSTRGSDLSAFPSAGVGNAETGALIESSSMPIILPYRSNGVDTGAVEAKRSAYKHKCYICGRRFEFPARLK